MKYTIDGSTLTGIADAIRTQYGEDTPIAVSDMAEAILGISGGGGGEGQFNVATTMLMAEGNTLTFEHDLGTVPRFFIIFPTNLSDIVGNLTYKFVAGLGAYGVTSCVGTGNAAALRAVSATNTIAKDENTITYTVVSTTYKLAVGVEYSCIYW